MTVSTNGAATTAALHDRRSRTGGRRCRLGAHHRRWPVRAAVLGPLLAVGLVLPVVPAGAPRWAPAAAHAQLIEPVDGEVIDPYRPPAHVGAPGNRGWEYRTRPGAPVLAAAAGVVAFAGPIGGSLYVSIDHAGGLRSTYSLLGEIRVDRGAHVPVGALIGTSTGRFHFGVRRDGEYADPAALISPSSEMSRPRLISASRRIAPIDAPRLAHHTGLGSVWSRWRRLGPSRFI